MKQYKRATQRRLDLLSINDYTIPKEDEQRRASSRKIKRATLLDGRKDHGGEWNYSGGSSSEDRSGTAQYQQGNAPKRCGELGFFTEDSGEHRARCGDEDSSEEIGDAA